MPGSQRRLSESIARRFVFLVHRGELASTEVIASATADLDLNGSLGLVLEVLEAEPGISAAELARLTRVSRQAMLVPLRQLEERGLLVRQEVGPRVRTRPLALTGEGRRVAAIVRHRVESLEREALGDFSESERGQFRALLVRYAVAWEALATSGQLEN